MWDSIYHNAKILTHIDGDTYHVYEHGAIAIQDNQIAWVGDERDCELSHATQVIDVDQQWILPGFIDCHTHLVFAGERSLEFEMRQQGASYESIAKAGGGIVNTVDATRKASFETLYDLSKQRLEAYYQQGVTTLEIKSGYGLDLDTELKQLRVAKQLASDCPMNIVTTFLGAHALPKEYANKPDAYIQFVCEEVLPAVAAEGLADFVDVFTESIGFTLAQSERIFQAAQAHGLKIKCHAEQLTAMGGTSLASRYHATSVDHIEYITAADIEAMAQSNTVGVLLPAAFYTLKETQKPPIGALKQAGVPIALATDFNPGSSPTNNLLLVMNMACVLWGMTPQDALKAISESAAKALALSDELGCLQVGMQADFSVWDISHPRALVSMFDMKQCAYRVLKGERYD